MRTYSLLFLKLFVVVCQNFLVTFRYLKTEKNKVDELESRHVYNQIGLVLCTQTNRKICCRFVVHVATKHFTFTFLQYPGGQWAEAVKERCINDLELKEQ